MPAERLVTCSVTMTTLDVDSLAIDSCTRRLERIVDYEVNRLLQLSRALIFIQLAPFVLRAYTTHFFCITLPSSCVVS